MARACATRNRAVSTVGLSRRARRIRADKAGSWNCVHHSADGASPRKACRRSASDHCSGSDCGGNAKSGPTFMQPDRKRTQSIAPAAARRIAVAVRGMPQRGGSLVNRRWKKECRESVRMEPPRKERIVQEHVCKVRLLVLNAERSPSHAGSFDFDAKQPKSERIVFSSLTRKEALHMPDRLTSTRSSRNQNALYRQARRCAMSITEGTCRSSVSLLVSVFSRDKDADLMPLHYA